MALVSDSTLVGETTFVTLAETWTSAIGGAVTLYSCSDHLGHMVPIELPLMNPTDPSVIRILNEAKAAGLVVENVA